MVVLKRIGNMIWQFFHRSTSSTKFQDLVPPVLDKIAMNLTLQLERGQSAIDLLPLRLVHRKFAQPVTSCIFSVCQIQEGAKESSTSFSRVIQVRRFLHFMKNPHICQTVKKVVINVHSGYTSGASARKDAETLHTILCAIADVVQVLHIAPGTMSWTRGGPRLLPLLYKRLRALTIGKAHLPLLPALLEQSPALKVLRITGQSHWTGVYNVLYKEMFQEWDSAHLPLKKLKLLEISHASQYRSLQLLARLPVQPEVVDLQIDAWHDKGLQVLAEGVTLPWTGFSRAKRVQLSFNRPSQERLTAIYSAVLAVGFEIERQQDLHGEFSLGVERRAASRPL